jgi:hypothetical protein
MLMVTFVEIKSKRHSAILEQGHVNRKKNPRFVPLNFKVPMHAFPLLRENISRVVGSMTRFLSGKSVDSAITASNNTYEKYMREKKEANGEDDLSDSSEDDRALGESINVTQTITLTITLTLILPLTLTITLT